MNILVIIPGDEFMNLIIDVLKSVYGEQDKICYVTLNKPYKSLSAMFKSKGLDPSSRIFFIDAITKTIFKPEDVWNCTFLSAPNAFDEVLTATRFQLQNHHFDIVVLDSLSTLLLYSDQAKVGEMIHSISTLISATSCEGMFICLKEDADKELVKRTSMFFDKVIDLAED